MTNKEKSVEEMLREGMCDHYGDPSTRISEILERIEQTERQKQETAFKEGELAGLEKAKQMAFESVPDINKFIKIK